MSRTDGDVGKPLDIIVNDNVLPDFTGPQGLATAILLTQWNAQFEARFYTPLLSMQARLLMHIAEHGSVSLGEAAQCVPLAHRTFYNMLSGLKGLGLVVVETDSADGRLRRLRLGDAFGSKSDDP
jgi:DNA-binding MarR family transcriptional regulator